MRDRVLIGAVVANVAVHVAEVALAATVMAPGSRDVPLAERMAWIATHPPGWTFGWAVWGSSAIIDVLFVAVIGRAVADRRAVTIAAGLTALGAVIDLTMDVLHVVVNPGLASQADPTMFLRCESIAWTVGAACANPLYCAGTVIVSAALLCARVGSDGCRWASRAGQRGSAPRWFWRRCSAGRRPFN